LCGLRQFVRTLPEHKNGVKIFAATRGCLPLAYKFVKANQTFLDGLSISTIENFYIVDKMVKNGEVSQQLNACFSHI
jgi:hypothetical protein